MSSLYNIEQDLLDIFNQIEELEGELTPELDDQLRLTQEEYKEKLEKYAHVVRQYEADIKVIKEEVERLNKRKKTFENRIERLKKVMLEAVVNFGPVETPKFKIGTRLSKSTNLDTYRIDTLSRGLMSFAREIHQNGVIAFGEDCDVEGMLAVVNANLKAEHEASLVLGYTNGEFIPFTLDDLKVAKININAENNLINLFTEKDGMLKAVLDNEQRFNIGNATDKTTIKNATEIYKDLTIGEVVENVNLSIK